MNTSSNAESSPAPPLPIGQFVERTGIIDLAWGHPQPELVPVEAMRAAASRALERWGPEALAYGYPAGAGPLIEFVCERLARTDARGPTPREVLVTAGASAGLDQVATLLTDPGEVVLVEAPTYHLAIRIFEDHPVHLVGVPTDEEGIQIGSLSRIVRHLRRSGRRPRLLYTVPTFNNPTGRSTSEPRRADLVTVAEAERITIVEDDAYRELAYEGPAPASLWSLGGEGGTVIRLGTYAKSIAPGLRLGYMTATAETVARFAAGGLLDSGGGANPFAGLAVAEYARVGDYARQVDLFRAAYRERRNAMLNALAATMPPSVQWTSPAGGYFVWVTLPPGAAAGRLLRAAEEAGTSFVPGRTFYLGRAGSARSLRLAFSRYPAATIEEAVGRLAATIRSTG